MVTRYSGPKQTEIIDEIFDTYGYRFKYAADNLWKGIGTDARTIADDLRTQANRLTDRNDGGWSGPAAEAFLEEVQKVVDFADEIARGAKGEGDGNVWAKLHAAADEIEKQQDDEHTRPIPWSKRSSRCTYTDYGWNEDNDKSYFAYDDTGGDPEANKRGTTYNHDDWQSLLGELGISTRTEDEVVWPADDSKWPEIFEAMDANRAEREACTQAKQDMGSYLGDLKINDAPEVPKFKVAPDAGGGPDVGGPGAPSTDTSKPDIPETKNPPIPKDTDNDGIPDDQDPHPNDPDLPDSDNDGIPDDQDPHPNDPDLPDSDNDGIPDDQDPFPNDPDHNNDGIPDGSTGAGAGSVDTGTETARAGGGGFSGAGGGGLGSGSGPGGVGAGAGGAGAGVGPGGAGMGAGMGAGGAMGRGGMGGMMPMMGGGGAGAGAGGEEQERNTWLEEDEDVWGTGDDGPPPVIGG
ncbi:MAG: hypothetical protein ACRDP8_14535 [Actinopolymorphaceae bacterium]